MLHGIFDAFDLGECALVTLMRRLLTSAAALWAAFGFVLLVAPSWLVETVLDQVALAEDTWLRVAGLMAVALAAQMVLIAHRVEELWWWSWTFVLLEAGTAVLLFVNAIAGVPAGASAWPWWILGALNGAIAALELVALARIGIERPVV
jgi:hypothetical protein